MTEPAYVAPSPATLAQLLPTDCDASPAVILPSSCGPTRAGTYSYGELRALVTSLQHSLLAAGVSPGSRVAMSLPNGLEIICAFLSVCNLRAVAAPLNPAYTKDEVQFYLRDTQCSCLLVPEEGAEAARAAAKECGVLILEVGMAERRLRLRPAREQGAGVAAPSAAALAAAASSRSPLPIPLPSDVCLVLHTSGTTSAPKGVPLSHGNLCRTVHNICGTYRLRRSDVGLLVMPLFHVHGLMAGLLSPLAAGGAVAVPPRFSAGAFWADCAAAHCTWYTAVPTMHQILLARPADEPAFLTARPALRFVRSCSSALAAATHGQLEQRLRVPVLEAYAMTEAAHQMTSNELPPGRRVAGSVGRGQGVEVSVLDAAGRPLPAGTEGEICVRGANVTAGYLNNPAANASSFTAEGFFRTGDQGYVDAAGFVFVTGRLKELINRGGEKIAPAEVDSALLTHGAVSEAVAFAAPHPVLGQEVAAAVVPAPREWEEIKAAGPVGSAARAAAEDRLRTAILQQAKQKLAPFKLPKQVFFADQLPKTATGKIQRRHVAEHFLKQTGQQGQPIKAKL